MKQKQNSETSAKNISFINIISIGILIFFLASYYLSSLQKRSSYNEFLKMIEQDQISEILIGDEQLIATMKDTAKTIITFKVEDPNLISLLKTKNIKFQGVAKSSFWSTFFIWVLPLVFIVFFFASRITSQSTGLLAFNKSKAKVYEEKDIKDGFADVAGCDEAKEELIEVVSFLKDPKKYSRLGGRVPKGILLVGPPGTGKTLIARAIAGEAQVPFFSINGSEFVELFVGMGAARVRDLFDQARSKSPCIIFIDELDALGKTRSLGTITGSHDEKEQTLNQLLAELDGFDPSSGVVLLAATNRPEVLDPALLRSGRFDRQVLLDKPDQRGRLQILNIHVKKITIKKEVKLEDVASMTPGFTGADLANLVNEAALIATRRNAAGVELNDFTSAIERIVAGLERKQRLINPDEKRRVAFHEMGHTTATLALQTKARVQKVSIIPRGYSDLGYTLQRPLEDRYIMTRTELNNKIAMLLSGRVSEQIFCEDLSTGAGDDLVKASNIARAMVTQYGMGESMGLVSEEATTSRFLQIPEYPAGTYKSWSDKTGEKIDLEVKSILNYCKILADKILRKNKEFIEAGVAELLRKETLDTDEIQNLWKKFGKTDEIEEIELKNKIAQQLLI